MTAKILPLVMEQGATFQRSMTWCYPGEEEGTAGDPHDLTGYKGRMQIRSRLSSPVLLDATTENEQIIFGIPPGGGTPDPTNGRIMLFLRASSTNALVTRRAVYDLEIEDPTGIVYRLLEGKIDVKLNTTRES